MIQLIFNVFPLSVNKLYVNIPGQKRRFVSTEGKKFKTLIETEVKTLIKNPDTLNELAKLEGKCLSMEIKVSSSSWFLKDGKTIRQKDLSSVEKALVDSIFTAFKDLGFNLDDKQIWSLNLEKEYGISDITEVKLYEFHKIP